VIDQDLLKILVCPKCKTTVQLSGDRLICMNGACGLRYPVREGIPVMLIDEAEKPSSS